ncbi:hypothetical protein GSUET_22130 [Geobacter sulfurreducens subsp. ethanolicus]|uniref:hypothetical protein n=1 Tax=Geobacter sulfurreducens TaxID=35554 RepID=UPI002572A071|nr:hypothetical protein [Geobacter sulfurreducens]BEH10601.1 hypothetical protein GSUET_22130 [Geobacter sulfurreducens subsp. ethanolicus]
MTPAQRYQALDDRINQIQDKHAPQPDHYAAVIDLTGLLTRLIARKKWRDATTTKIKAHLAAHVHNPDLHRDLLEILHCFIGMIEIVIADPSVREEP